MSSTVSFGLGSFRGEVKTQYLQVGVGIVATTFAGGLAYYPLYYYYGEPVANDFYRSCQWAAITVLLVTTPFLGQTMQTGAERAFGTMLGGLIGWLINFISINEFFISVSTAMMSVVFLTVFWILNLEYAGKIGAMTMLIVSMGGFVQGTSRETLALAVTRTSGILGGILVSTIVSITVVPHPAAAEVMKLVKESIQTVKEFNLMAWDSAPASFCSSSAQPPDLDGEEEEGSSQAKGVREFEKKLSFRGFRRRVHSDKKKDVYSKTKDASTKSNEDRVLSLSKEVIGLGQQAKSCFRYSRHERHFWISGSSIFLPTWPFVSDTIPENEFADLRDSVSRLWRIIWSLNLSLFDGFGMRTQQRILKRIPPTLMPNIREAADDTLGLLQESFPLIPMQPQENICITRALERAVTLRELVELLLDLSLWNRHQAHVKVQEMALRASRGDLTESYRRASPLGSSGSSVGLYSNTEYEVTQQTVEELAMSPRAKDFMKQTNPEDNFGKAARRTLLRSESSRTARDSPTRSNVGKLERPDLALQVLPEVPSVSDMVKSLQEDTLFDDSPEGFLEEVRWMSFVYELKVFSSAITSLVDNVKSFLAKLPTRTPQSEDYARETGVV